MMSKSVLKVSEIKINKINKVDIKRLNLAQSISVPLSLSKVKLRLDLNFLSILIITITGTLPILAQAEGLADLFANSEKQTKFLPVEQAFSVAAQTQSLPAAKSPEKTTLTVNFTITPGHYVYKEKLKLTLPASVHASPFIFNQTANHIDDPQFGRVAVFDQNQVTATTELSNKTEQPLTNVPVNISWQGCAKAGLCYPPEKLKTTVNVPAITVKDNTKDKSSTLGDKAQKPKSAKQDASKPAQPTNDNNVADTASATAKQAKEATKRKIVSKPVDITGQTNTKNNKALSASISKTSSDENNPQAITNGGLVTSNLMASDNELTKNQTNGLVLNQTYVNEKQSGLNQPFVDNNANPQLTSNKNTANVATDSSPSVNDAGTLPDGDPFGLARHPLLAIFLLFLAGLGLALTPCVLPMLPIVANIVAQQKKPTTKTSFLLTSSYALGVAIAYGILGALIAVFGASLGIIGWLQNPAVLLTFAAIFIVLAVYMLGWLPIGLPHKLNQKMAALNDQGTSYLGSSGGSLIAGFLSALVVSPCVSAPLFGALLAVSTIGKPILGFAALFALGFGLSTPLIILGTTQGGMMPKAGAWMDWVKQGFALLLVAVALLLVGRVYHTTWMLALWAAWFMIVAIWAWSWSHKGQIATKAGALLAGSWAILLLIGMAMGAKSVWQPLAPLTLTMPIATTSGVSNQASGTHQTAPYTTITTIAQLDKIVAQSTNVLVDVTADWCVECRIMEQTLFAKPPAQLKQWQVVKLDITQTNADSKEVLKKFNLFGPPALVYYQQGKLTAMQVGETKRGDFEDMLTKLTHN